MSSFSEETEHCLAALQQRLDALIDHHQQLSAHQKTLEAECAQLQQHRDDLATQNEQLRARIDAIVARLKGMGVS